MLDAVAELAPHSPITAAASAFDPMPSVVRMPSWCVVRTHTRAERRAHAALHLRGFDAYLPLVTVRWRDRTWHTKPAFVGYCFVRLDLAKPWSPVLACPGVFHLLRVNSRPATCSDAVVAALREAVDASEDAIRCRAAEKPSWAPGALLAVSSGVLRDCHCVLLSHHNGTAKVAAMIAGHLCTVSVPLDCLRARD